MGRIEVEAELHVGGRLDVDGGAAGETVEARGLQVAVLIEVTDGEVVIALVGGAAGGEVILHTGARVDGLVEPVEVILVALEDVGIGDELAVLEEFGVGLVEDVELEALGDEVGIGVSCSSLRGVAIVVLAVVLEGEPLDVHELTCVGEVVLGDTTVVGTGGGAELDRHAALVALLGGDEDDTVGCAVAVQGGGGGILEDGHGLDVGRVEVGEVTAVGNSVDHVEGRGATVDGTVTADHDGRVGTGVTEGAVDLHAGDGAFEGACNAGYGSVGNLLGTHLRDGAREGRPLGRAVCDGHDGLLQRFAVRGHDRVDRSGDGEFLGLHTDEGENEDPRTGGDVGDDVVTVEIGHGSNLGALHEHGHSGKRLSVLVEGDLTTDGGRGLCESGTCQGHDGGQEKEQSFH